MAERSESHQHQLAETASAAVEKLRLLRAAQPGWSDSLLKQAVKMGDREGDRLARLVLEARLPETVIAGLSELERRQRELNEDSHRRLADQSSLSDLLERQRAIRDDLRHGRRNAGGIGQLAEYAGEARLAELAMEMAIEALLMELPDSIKSAQETAARELGHARAKAERQVQELTDSGQTKSVTADVENFQRVRYNGLLDVADKMIESMELILVQDTEVSRDLSDYPADIVEFFQPIECPKWVEEGKLARAQELWSNHMLTSLMILYSSSLPWCYIIKNGMALLYATGKLSHIDSSLQRIYETGILLDSAMSVGGITVVNDLSHDHRALLVRAVNELDPELQFHFDRQNKPCFQGPKSGLPRWGVIIAKVEELRAQRPAPSRPQPQRYLWGKGVMQTKKVRILHATMRYMALNPQDAKSRSQVANKRFTDVLAEIAPKEKWNVKKLDYPINQEDLAFVLLTFGYCIPLGMENWGYHLSLEDKNAFLHSWKVVGHVLGIESELMTDDWKEAGELFERIAERRGGWSEAGVKLTTTLCDFAKGYLPCGDRLVVFPPLFIADHLGRRRSDDLFTDEQKAIVRNPLYRALFWVIKHLFIRLYFRVRTGWLGRSLLVEAFLGRAIHSAAEAYLDSLRNDYARRPFYLPKALDADWERQAGFDQALEDDLKHWRAGLLGRVAIGVSGLYVSAIGVAGAGLGAAVAMLRDMMIGQPDAMVHAGWTVLEAGLGLSGAGFMVAMVAFHLLVPAQVARRPPLTESSASTTT